MMVGTMHLGLMSAEAKFASMPLCIVAGRTLTFLPYMGAFPSHKKGLDSRSVPPTA